MLDQDLLFNMLCKIPELSDDSSLRARIFECVEEYLEEYLKDKNSEISDSVQEIKDDLRLMRSSINSEIENLDSALENALHEIKKNEV